MLKTRCLKCHKHDIVAWESFGQPVASPQESDVCCSQQSWKDRRDLKCPLPSSELQNLKFALLSFGVALGQYFTVPNFQPFEIATNIMSHMLKV